MTRRGRAGNALFVGAVTCGLLGTGLVGLGAHALETSPPALCIPGTPGSTPPDGPAPGIGPVPTTEPPPGTEPSPGPAPAATDAGLPVGTEDQAVTDAPEANLPFCADLPECIPAEDGPLPAEPPVLAPVETPLPLPGETPVPAEAPAAPAEAPAVVPPPVVQGDEDDDEDDDQRKRKRKRNRDRDDDDRRKRRHHEASVPVGIAPAPPAVAPPDETVAADVAGPAAVRPLGCGDPAECVDPAPPADPALPVESPVAGGTPQATLLPGPDVAGRPVLVPVPDGSAQPAGTPAPTAVPVPVETPAPADPAASAARPTPPPVVLTADVPALPAEGAPPAETATPLPTPGQPDVTPVATAPPPPPAGGCVPLPSCDMPGDGGTAPPAPAEPTVTAPAATEPRVTEPVGSGIGGPAGGQEPAAGDEVPGPEQATADSVPVEPVPAAVQPAVLPPPENGTFDDGSAGGGTIAPAAAPAPDTAPAAPPAAETAPAVVPEDAEAQECEAPPAPGEGPAQPQPTVLPVPGDPGSDPGAEPEPTPPPQPEPTALPEPEPTPAPEPTTVPKPAPVLQKGGPINRAQMISRATSWVVQKVPYSQVRWWSDQNGRYRQDCSGMVSMAWNLSQKTNYWTGNLAKVSHRIPSSSMKPGDILLWPTHHTLIFTGWANSAKTRFNLMEQYSSGKPARYALNASLSYYLNRGFGAYRYDNVVDSAVPPIKVKLTAGGSALADEIVLTSAETALPDLSGLAAEQWTEETADDWTDESAAPAAKPGMTTPDPVADLPVETLVDQQLEMDKAAARAAFLQQAPGQEHGSLAGSLIAAGLGLLFLAFPLGMGARTVVRVPQRK